MTEENIWIGRPSILASVEGSPLVQAVNPKFLDWLLEVEAHYKPIESKAEKWDKYTLDGKNITPEIIEQIEALEQKIKAIKEQVIEPQLKDSKEYLDANKKPEPHDVVMSRYWLEKGIHGTVSEIKKILEPSLQFECHPSPHPSWVRKARKKKEKEAS